MKQRDIAELYGCGKSTIGDFLRGDTYKEWWESYDDKPVAGGTMKISEKNRTKLKPGSVHIFTSAQNNTYVHKKFLKSLEVAKKHRKAELRIATFHYNKNAYSKADAQDDECWFDPKIRKYICNEPLQIAEDLVFCGEIDIPPTVKNPTSGFDCYTEMSSAIIPHARLHLTSLPTPKHEKAKLMYTTGAVTQLNYIQRKPGQLAQDNHSFSALIVEVDKDGEWFVRQVTANGTSGEFYDLDVLYTPNGYTKGHSIEAFNPGDVHAAKLDQEVYKCVWGKSKKSLINTLKPKYQLLHDVFDMAYRNHHNIKDPYFRFKSWKDGEESVQDEVDLTAKVMKGMQRDFSKIIVVESNHNEALSRWLRESCYKNDPVNSLAFLKYQTATYKALYEDIKDFNIFEWAIKDSCKELSDVRFLKLDERFLVKGVECGVHGHHSSGGARGTPKAFEKFGVKHNTGHTHSAGIIGGIYTAGVFAVLDMGYNVGGSSWTQSGIVTYPNGKRAILTIRNGRWRGNV